MPPSIMNCTVPVRGTPVELTDVTVAVNVTSSPGAAINAEDVTTVVVVAGAIIVSVIEADTDPA